jgi:hypothetical protein
MLQTYGIYLFPIRKNSVDPFLHKKRWTVKLTNLIWFLFYNVLQLGIPLCSMIWLRAIPYLPHNPVILILSLGYLFES